MYNMQPYTVTDIGH